MPRIKVPAHERKKNVTVAMSPWLHYYISKELNINKSVLMEKSLLKELQLTSDEIENIKQRYMADIRQEAS